MDRILILSGPFQKSSARKEYSCNFCLKSFGGSSLLNLHLKTHRGPKLFGCPKCIKNFRNRRSFKAHLKSAHADEPGGSVKPRKLRKPKNGLKKKVASVLNKPKQVRSRLSGRDSNPRCRVTAIKSERVKVEAPEESDPLEVSGSWPDPLNYLEAELNVKGEVLESEPMTTIFIKEEPIC